jgi:hypothetical protein
MHRVAIPLSGTCEGKLVFAQLMLYLPLSTFRRCVADHRGEHKVKDFSCLDQFFAMAFAQLTYRESLRDIEVNLRAQAHRLYHMGFRCQTISRNTLANANATRPWQIHADFAQHLIGLARPLYAKEPFGLELDAAVYAFDASTIDLCLSVFAWAPFRSTKAAIKLHTLLDLRGNIPSFIYITDGKTHEVNVMDDLVLEPGAFYLMDRGYLDFARLFVIHEAQAFFVTRAKSNTKFKRRYSHPVDRINTAVLCDQTGVLSTYLSSKDYPTTMRRVVVKDDRKAVGVPDQQLLLEARVDCRLVPSALAGRTVLQMDQAAFAHHGVFWHHRERGEDADMDCHIDLPVDRHHEETLAS